MTNWGNGHGERHEVLVVDDEPAVRLLLSDFLEAEGYRVVTAANGLEALERFRHGDRPCFMLLDLMMPRLNGWELAHRLKSDPALDPVPFAIIASGAGLRPERDGLGAARWIGKPIDLDLLLDTLHQFCGAEGCSGCG
ncbi:MAG TPA: response regulator [Candidatus Limnocylindria bacterium]|nr:response regulator [Candidatus Limnocylindria bacterium]